MAPCHHIQMEMSSIIYSKHVALLPQLLRQTADAIQLNIKKEILRIICLDSQPLSILDVPHVLHAVPNNRSRLPIC